MFRNVEIEFIPGRVYALTGPSGSGKSTLLSILAGWFNPSEGRVMRPDSARTSWVFQNPHGIAHRSAHDHIALPLLAQGLSLSTADERAAELLEQFGLSATANHPFAHLSGGEAQRLMLARGIASNPDLLLIDEPTAQLDHTTSRTVNEAIASIANDGTVVAVATHDFATRDACSDQLDLSNWAWPRKSTAS
ncbi:ATP-binding cassette domain-containing protein [Leifsonia sp. NPDC058248]|uniref:ATP-binding cassette domain-containing protein n=1 Tax=Leifsonia sp. NPDC058248 TaxID=3346402 RepID=UPI0036D7CA3C